MYQDFDRVFIILSDLEMSTGDQYDDFPDSHLLESFWEQFRWEPYVDKEVDLVFNGDTFDFLKTPVGNQYPHQITETQALEKMKVIAKSHAPFFEGMKNFLSTSNRARRIHFIVGNHDPELLFPSVQNQIISLCGGSGQVLFPGFELKIGDLHIEHGSQHDTLFHIPPQKTFIKHKGKKILNIPWASVTLLNAFMHLRGDMYPLDRIKPRQELVKYVPELKEFVVSRLWRYWTKDYMKKTFTFADPLKKISWVMIKEAMKRTFSFNPEVKMSEFVQKRLANDEDVSVYVFGHIHQAKLWTHGNRKLIQTGAIRHEFMMKDDGKSYDLMPKSFAEIRMKNNLVSTANLCEFNLEGVPKERYPRPIIEYRPHILDALGGSEERLQERLEIEAIESEEEQ